METTEKTVISVLTRLNAPLSIVWNSWTKPDHIVNWNFASDDWCCPKVENDLQVGGTFSYRMESKDGKVGFDFNGVYDRITEKELIEYTLYDGRSVKVLFVEMDNSTIVSEEFEAEGSNSEELQRAGWQAILDNFMKYTESINKSK